MILTLVISLTILKPRMLQLNNSKAYKLRDIKKCLKTVFDPELDESIVDLGFISNIEIKPNFHVSIELKLPTYFCSANFAWIMCYDSKKAIEKLSWVLDVEVELVDHFVMNKVNKGLKNNETFSSIFGANKANDITKLRIKFDKKAYLNRQSLLIQFLRKKNLLDSEIVNMTLDNLTIFASKFYDDEFNKNLRRYKTLKEKLIKNKKNINFAFLDLDGSKIHENNLLEYLRTLRRTTGSITANSEMCKILMKERYSAGGQIQ